MLEFVVLAAAAAVVVAVAAVVALAVAAVRNRFLLGLIC